MKTFAVLSFFGFAAATFGDLPLYGDAPSVAHVPSAPSVSHAPVAPSVYHAEKPSYTSDCEEEAKVTPLPVYHKENGTCESYSETCYVTVTASTPYVKNATTPYGTGSPAAPTKAYYSNAANPLTGGAMAIGAGVLGALFM